MATGNETQITPPRVSIVDERTGAVSREWYRWFYSLYTIVGTGTGIIPVTSGGTGLGTIPTNGQLLIGNGSGYTINTLGYGAGISVTNGLGTIAIANTGVLSNIAGAGISVSGATGNVTIANTGVLSFSAGTTGLTPAATTTGVVTLAGKLVIANGGTNSTSTPTAGAVPYGTGTAYAFTAAGTSGQVLTSAGAGVPTWTTPTTGTVTSVGLAMPVQFTVTNSPVTSSGTLTAAFTTQSANSLFAGPTSGGGAVPTFRALTTADIPALPYGSGTVTSVALTLPSIISVSGSPVTTSGTLAGTLTTQSVNSIFAGPSSGAAAAPTFRALTTTDIPALSYVTSVALALPSIITVSGSPVTSSGTLTGTLTTQAVNSIFAGPSSGAAAAPTFRALTTADIPALAYGSVTSVSFTGGIVSVATPTTTPALTVAGTSGGVPYFSSGTTWASSAALAANAIVLGGGAGAAPATTTTGTGVVTALGVNTGTAGAFVVNGGALGTPSSGTVTNLTGTASININGTVGATTANTGAFTTVSATGVITSTVATGTAPFTVASTTQVANLNAATAGTAAALSATLAATSGGTGQSSYAVGDLLYASTTTALSKLADVATGNALISGGVSTAPSWGKIGLTTHVSGTLPVANGGTNLTSFTANGVMYASSTSALATGSALTFDGTNLATTGSATAARFIPTGSTIPTNGMYLSSANVVAFATNSTYAFNISSDQRVQIGSGSAAGKLSVYGDAVNFSPSADNSSNGIGCCVLGSNIASATSSLGKLYMSGGNSAHAGNLALYSGSVVTSAITMTNTSGTTQTTIDGNGNATLVGVYSATVGATNRDLYVDNTGKLGYVSSVRESKTNILPIDDISWLNNLEPVTFNRKKKEDIFSSDEYHVKIGERYANETYEELEYGLIAEDVEKVNPELCFYDEVDGQKKLAGVHYSKLIIPLLAKLNQLTIDFEKYKAAHP